MLYLSPSLQISINSEIYFCPLAVMFNFRIRVTGDWFGHSSSCSWQLKTYYFIISTVWSMQVFWYIKVVILPNIVWMLPVPLDEKHLEIMMLPTPNFTVGFFFVGAQTPLYFVRTVWFGRIVLQHDLSVPFCLLKHFQRAFVFIFDSGEVVIVETKIGLLWKIQRNSWVGSMEGYSCASRCTIQAENFDCCNIMNNIGNVFHQVEEVTFI